MEPTNKDLLDIELNFDDLKAPSEEARERMRQQHMEDLQNAFVAQIRHYMSVGNMPRNLWDKLPKQFKKIYSQRFKGMAGHYHGVPMTMAQKLAAERKRRKSRDKYLRAKQARKVMYRNGK